MRASELCIYGHRSQAESHVVNGSRTAKRRKAVSVAVVNDILHTHYLRSRDVCEIAKILTAQNKKIYTLVMTVSPQFTHKFPSKSKSA